MAEKSKGKKPSVRILDRRKLLNAREIKVVVKGGRVFTFKISKPVFNGKQLILQDGDGALMVTSLNKLARDIERYFKAHGLEPLYVYPATQLTLSE